MLSDSPKLSKEEMRRKIWTLMEETGISRFPKPVYGRIPNFIGLDIAAQKLAEQWEFKRAKVIKVNPDSPQRMVRLLTLLMPTPRLSSGFLLLEPRKIPKRAYEDASSIRGAFKYGKICSINEIPNVDLIVAGSVAVSRDRVRVGKGGGYGEIEYGILRELGVVDEKTPIFTTVHDIQIVDFLPKDIYDLTVDAIITPTRVIRIDDVGERPKGIMWDRIESERINEIPPLTQLRKLKSLI